LGRRWEWRFEERVIGRYESRMQRQCWRDLGAEEGKRSESELPGWEIRRSTVNFGQRRCVGAKSMGVRDKVAHLPRAVAILGAVLSVWGTQTARAQMVYLGGAGSYSTTESASTFRSYKFGYQRNLIGNWSSSLDYLNEGHFPGHHRDGYALELSYETELLARFHIWLCVGAGPYYYFDTQTSASGASLDVHGLAPIVTFRARHRLSANWDVIVSLDSIFPTHDFRAQTVTIEGGYWLGKESELARQTTPVAVPPATPSAVSTAAGTDAMVRAALRSEPTGFFEKPYQAPVQESEPKEASEVAQETFASEWALFGAVSVINIAGNPRADGGSAEYRLRMSTQPGRQYDLSFAYLYEGDPRLDRRHGVAAEVWPVRTDRHLGVDVAAGIGAYVFVVKNSATTGPQSTAAVAPIISMMVSWTPKNQKFFYRAIWDRVVSSNNQDADVWRLGVGSTL